MDTLTIEFEDRNMISVIRNLINSMNGVRIISSIPTTDIARQKVPAKDITYNISPTIKAMEVGASLPKDISDDYRKEIGEIKEHKFL